MSSTRLIQINSSYYGDNKNDCTNLLLDSILEGPIEQRALIDPYHNARRVSKSAALTAAICANSSFIPITLKAGIPYAIGNSVSFLSLDYWAINGTFDEVFGPRGESEAILMTRGAKGKCYRISLAIGAVAIAILSQVPIALPALDYDGELKVPAFIALLLGGSILPLRSLQLSINKSIQMQKWILGETGKKIEEIRSEITSAIQEYQTEFEQIGMNDKLQIVSQMNSIRNRDDMQKIEPYLSTILDQLTHPKPKEPSSRYTSACNLLGRVTSKLIGSFLAASLETGLTLYTFDKTKKYMTDDDIGAGIFTAAVISSGIYLYGKSVINTTEQMAKSVFATLTRQRSKRISEQFRPSLTLSLKLLGLALNLGTIGPNLVIWGDFFKDKKEEQLFFKTTLCCAYFILVSTATLAHVDNTVKQVIASKGNDNEKQIIQLHRDLQKLQKLVENSPILDFSIFLRKCPQEIRTALLRKVGLSLDSLHEYSNRLA